MENKDLNKPIYKRLTKKDQHPNWRNEFLDVVFYDGGDLTFYRWCICMEGNYITSKGGLNQAKSFVNNKRGLKTKWIKINSKEL